MVVEDEGVARRALTWLLSSSGYRATAFATAEEALQAVENDQPPQLALVDVDLPGMNGLELAARLERIDPKLKVVLVTAVEGERINHFRRQHSVEYMRKPVDFQHLLQMLTRQSPSN